VPCRRNAKRRHHHRHQLAAIVDRVITDGDRYDDQLSLFDIA
jgi:hypothetical protein